jgi:hypothetical protein
MKSGDNSCFPIFFMPKPEDFMLSFMTNVNILMQKLPIILILSSFALPL